MNEWVEEFAKLSEAGDPAALELVFRKTSGALFGFLLSLLKSRQDAEEVLQDLFVKLAERGCSIPDPRLIEPWLFRSARNAAIDLLRRKGRAVRALNSYSTLLEGGSCEAPCDSEALKLALGELSPALRETVALKAFEGLTFDQIAKRLGKSLNTVASRWRCALERLRRSLEDA